MGMENVAGGGAQDMKIMGYNYRIQLKNSRKWYGECSTKKARIRLSTRQSRQVMTGTMLHEILEVLNYYLELGLNHQGITALESGIHQVFCDAGVDLTPLIREAEEQKRRRRK